MTGYVDIHAHIVPGIDDGPSDLDGSIALAQAAVEIGTTTLAATPHLRADFPAVRAEDLAWRCQQVRHTLAGAGVPLDVISGAEVSLLWALDASDEQLRLASYDQRGSDLLLETPLGGVIGADRIVYEVQARGFRITLGHPERNTDFQRDPEVLERMVNHGILLQVNADSLASFSRRAPVRRLAEHLCRQGLAHVLASDGHRASSWRAVSRLADGVEALGDLVGPDRAHWMAADAPGAILRGWELPDAPPVAAGRRKARLLKRS